MEHLRKSQTMSDTELTQDAAYQLRRALGAVRDLREKLQAVESTLEN